MTGALPVERIQRWMQAVLVHPEGAAAGLSSRKAARLLPATRAHDVVRLSGGLSAADRLEIYAEMYPLRMVEALRADYPALASFLGDERFERLVRDYVAAHPSRSYTLARLGDRLPGFVAGWGPSRQRHLLTDIARLELAATRVFDAEDVVPLTAEALGSVPAEDFSSMRLVPVPALAVLRVCPGAIGVLDAFLASAPPPATAERGHAWVVFRRKGFTVFRRTLPKAAGRLMALLAEGNSLHEAVPRAIRSASGPRPSPDEVFEWFREWLRLGDFADMSLANR